MKASLDTSCSGGRLYSHNIHVPKPWPAVDNEMEGLPTTK